MSLWWLGEAEDEVFAFPSKTYEYKTNQGTDPFPIHFRAPSRILWRTIRGMIPHKTKRGATALERLKEFEGVPAPYDKVKTVVIPNALKGSKITTWA